jgi:hypothetical protein
MNFLRKYEHYPRLTVLFHATMFTLRLEYIKLFHILNFAPLLISCTILGMLVSIAEWSKECTVYNHLNTGIAGLNPAWGMDACLHVSVLCCPVLVEALCWADPPAKESYQMSICRLRRPLG